MTLVRKTFLVFVSVFVIQIFVVALLLFFGYRQSENEWRSVRTQQAHEAARIILTGELSRLEMSEYAGQLAVYDENKNIMATSRGMGMRSPMARGYASEHLYPVEDEGKVIGYYATGTQVFVDDTANQALLGTMIWVLLISLMLSLGIALLAAMHFSRKISSPADKLALSLRAMTGGDVSTPVVSSGSDELVRIAESIESLRQRLLHERTVRSQWSQDVAHDLRTPVASMKAQLEGMVDGVLNPTTERLERTGRELSRMEALIGDLEVLMRLESPEARITRESIDAAAFANEMSQRFEAQMSLKDIHYSHTVDILSFIGDESYLARAVSNLLANAVRHVDPGGTIMLTITADDSSAVLSVQNSGFPIPPEELPKVFERLYRGEYARNSTGSGLGLTIVDRIARLHGGSASITSTTGEGTEVRLTLPRSIV